ncbi:glycosylhydrolase-like jelly roll fold domain-containing protein, partial [Parabacteroides distasonis]
IYWNNGNVLSIGSSEKIEEYVIMGNWVVRFDSCWGKSEPVIFNKLYSWTDSEDPEIRYFSGKAIYENTFYIKTEQLRDKKMKLDLGNVQDLAVIKVNDHAFPVSWSAPFEVDITPYVKEGQNTLSIEIVNLWPNRLIGDSKLPKQERRTKTNIVKFDAPDSEKYLRTSGLLGPVKIRSFKQVKIEDL